ncbi:MAG: right-handed parallel beta-helix repeat-containing protein [Anaerolineales bacterium]|nr:right-handed parallel beta-helix repeat-containing protein [Anaerolineales bacterium]
MLRKRLLSLMIIIFILAGCGASERIDPLEMPGSAVRVTLPAASVQAPAETPAEAIQGETYYVATNGDDLNPGSALAPWRTLQHAVEQVLPGDTILVMSGTYQGMRIETSGSAQAWISLKAAPGAQVIVNAPGPGNKHDSNIEIETWEGEGVVAYWIVEGLEVANAPGWGIDLRGSEDHKSHHLTIRNNKVHHNGVASGKTGIFAAFVDDLLIEGNESYANGEHGVYVSNSSDRYVVRGNKLYQNQGCGVHQNGDASMGGDGILSDGVVENNLIYGNGASGGAAINMDGVVNALVRNNLIYDNTATGIAIFQQDGAVCSQNNRILHNTILMPANGRWAVLIGGTGCTGNQLYNNIILSLHSYRGAISLPAPAVAGFESDYNIVADRFTTDDGDSILSLAQWQSNGYDLHSFLGLSDDLFVNSASKDFHLVEDSPAVDAGFDLPDVTADLDGQPRPSGDGYDTGAYEYQQMIGLDPRAYFALIIARLTP